VRLHVKQVTVLMMGLVIAIALAALFVSRVTGSHSQPTLLVARCEVFLGLVTGESASLVREAVALRHRRPSDKARLAATGDDYRLVGVAGFGVFFPGTPPEAESQLSTPLGVRQILGAGDGGDAYVSLYQGASYDFALRYNSTILEHLKARVR